MADTGRMLALRRMHNILSEVLICARLSASPYIVTCHGAASDWGEVGVLFEYCNKGTLTSATLTVLANLILNEPIQTNLNNFK